MYIVPRELVDDIKNLTYDELIEYARARNLLEEDEDAAWVQFHELLGRNIFFEFGKYYENDDNICNLGTPLFLNPDTQKSFKEYNPYVVGKEAVFSAIEHNRKKIVDWYNSLLMTQEEYDESCKPYFCDSTKQEDRIKAHLIRQKEEWQNNFNILAINTDMKSPKIVNSWLYEYEIFELVHQLKIMDWEKNTLVFYGW